uniref:Uncharacterized protein n=1 Tax=Anopheles albimanus TaxID=7167 RepID=A0A182FZ31_ANOAL
FSIQNASVKAAAPLNALADSLRSTPLINKKTRSRRSTNPASGGIIL